MEAVFAQLGAQSMKNARNFREGVEYCIYINVRFVAFNDIFRKACIFLSVDGIIKMENPDAAFRRSRFEKLEEVLL